MTPYASKKKRARKKSAPPKKAAAKKTRLARKATPKAAKKRASKKPAVKKATAQAVKAKRAAAAKVRRAAALKAERKAQASRDRRNRLRREARAEAKRQEVARLERLAKARRARERAKKRSAGVNRKQHKLRLENEKLRLPRPRTTKEKKLEVREEVNHAVQAPPIVAEFTQSFNKLFAIAKRTNQLPHIDYRQRIINSDQSKGVKRAVRIEMLVTEDAVEEILHRVKRASSQLAGYKIWMATTIMSSMGPEIVGSGGRMLHSGHPLAFKFQTEAHDTTGIWSSEKGMLARLESILDDWADAEHSSLVYLHSVLVRHFTRIK